MIKHSGQAMTTTATKGARTAAILAEIASEGSTRDSIAVAYQLGIIDCHFSQDHDFVDWPTVNAAILKRYKPSGLNYIKHLAWKR